MRKDYHPQTLNEFITFQQTAFPYAKGDLSRLLNHIGLASKIVSREVNMAGLAAQFISGYPFSRDQKKWLKKLKNSIIIYQCRLVKDFVSKKFLPQRTQRFPQRNAKEYLLHYLANFV